MSLKKRMQSFATKTGCQGAEDTPAMTCLTCLQTSDASQTVGMLKGSFQVSHAHLLTGKVASSAFDPHISYTPLHCPTASEIKNMPSIAIIMQPTAICAAIIWCVYVYVLGCKAPAAKDPDAEGLKQSR